MIEKKKLPIGEEFFRNIRTKGFYYVDKTEFISELLRTRGSVNLFTRPRRFGKSLNLDMLKTFFEIGTDAALFENLKISEEKELCEQYMGRYPVVSISLKDVGGEDFQTAYETLSTVVSEEAARLGFLMESSRLMQYDKARFERLAENRLEKPSDLYNSLKLLTRLLRKHYGVSAIVLIDEYDVPLDKAYQNGYYPQMVSLIRSIFSQALKTNENLEFAVITGCLQIARESIFTGLNNFKIRTVSDVRFAKYFGFTDLEVKALLDYYNLGEKFGLFKEWYDGYRFGNTHVYCPWDVLNQCDKFCESKNARMESHWENSSSNHIVKDILEHSNETTRAEIEALISGECVEKPLISGLTYQDFDSREPQKRQTYLWSILFATGYLTDAGEPAGKVHKLVIPNREILEIYEDRIHAWFETRAVSNTERWKEFCKAVKRGDGEKVGLLFDSFMNDSISIRDTYVRKEMKENFYHGMLLGLMRAEESWIVKSNAESGIGYTDILIMIPSERVGCIMEVKYAENGAFETACNQAMKQIEDGGYMAVLKQEDMRTIHKFGIACYKKSCRVTAQTM
ncbi:AAA family ATPase [Otoolea muris]|uniref:AAA family ATPase n=1 Tax=Otoolea muris TaxID=2941515 RepID=UPI00203E8657|nr:AAA family ATPase [Otoolea muris]